MFHSIRSPILERMRYLEQMDAQDRENNTPRLQRLRQIPRETGKFLAWLAAAAPEVDALIVPVGKGELVCRKV